MRAASYGWQQQKPKKSSKTHMVELERRGHQFSRYADGCNIYVGSQAAGERVKESVQGLRIEKHLRLQVNAAKSGVGRTWERKFPGVSTSNPREAD